MTLCVDRRSRRATAERCFRCASASSSRVGGIFDRRFPLDESSSDVDVDVDVTVIFAGVDDDGRDVVTLTTAGAAVVVVVIVGVVVDDVDSLTPAPDRRRTYGPALLGLINDPSPTVRSVVPHLNTTITSFVSKLKLNIFKKEVYGSKSVQQLDVWREVSVIWLDKSVSIGYTG